MNVLSVIGAFFITLSLLSYGIGCISIQRFRLVTPWVLIFISLGVLLDFIAVFFMIKGAQNSVFSIHGLLGYSAMLTMMVLLFLVFRSYQKNGWNSVIEKGVVIYTKISYGWWVITYFTGSIIVIWA